MFLYTPRYPAAWRPGTGLLQVNGFHPIFNLPSACLSVPVLQSKSHEMSSTLVHKLCRSLQTPALTKKYSDAAVGLVLLFFIQLLVLPTQIALDLHSIKLPASILVMLLVLIIMTIASSINNDTMQFYNRHLRGPTDFLGRHMSLGFVAFFILLIRDHINSSSDVPKLAGVFGM